MDKTGWITHCFGRFLIDLPSDAVIDAGYYLWGDRIEYLGDTPTELAARIDRLEQEWMAQKHKTKGNMFLRKIDFGNDSTGLLSWSSEAASKTYLLDTYVTSKPTWHAYRWKGKVSVDREQRAVEISRALARNLRSRAPKEVPSEPGFCIDQAYIAGDSFQVERFGVGVTFPEHPGARFEFRSSTGAAQKSLFERVGGFMQSALSTLAGMEVLKKRKRPVGNLPGDEYLVAGSDNGQRGYTFMWDVQGKDESLTEPHLTAGLAVLERSNENGKPPPLAFKSDKEALELWDAIVDSIRVRPTSSSPRGGTAVVQPARPCVSLPGAREPLFTPCRVERD